MARAAVRTGGRLPAGAVDADGRKRAVVQSRRAYDIEALVAVAVAAVV